MVALLAFLSVSNMQTPPAPPPASGEAVEAAVANAEKELEQARIQYQPSI